MINSMGGKRHSSKFFRYFCIKDYTVKNKPAILYQKVSKNIVTNDRFQLFLKIAEIRIERLHFRM